MVVPSEMGEGERAAAAPLAFCWEEQGGGVPFTLKAQLELFFASFLNSEFSRFLVMTKPAVAL